MPESLTACVIARDEERRLPSCLKSLAFCDEIVVVDGGSSDRTVEIARDADARVIQNPWPGFAAQRNVALDHAHGDWILEVDADERVSPALAREIRALLTDPPADLRMATIPMRDLFLGRPLGPSMRYPRYRNRLFRRGAFRHDEARVVHEGLWPDGPTIPLRGELTHLLASSWREAVRDVFAYAKLEGAQRTRISPLEGLTGGVLRPSVKLAYRVLLYGAWRDGWRGLAKVSLECAGDVLAAIYRLRVNDTEDAEPGFGHRPPRIGPVRLVGLAIGGTAGARLSGWLDEAAAVGADVSLICVEPPQSTTVRCRVLSQATPSSVVQAIDAEDQVRPIDALVAASWREHLLARLAPGSIRGVIGPLDPSSAPRDVERRVRSLARTPIAT